MFSKPPDVREHEPKSHLPRAKRGTFHTGEVGTTAVFGTRGTGRRLRTGSHFPPGLGARSPTQSRPVQDQPVRIHSEVGQANRPNVYRAGPVTARRRSPLAPPRLGLGTMLHCTPFQCKASVFLFGSAYCPTAHTSVEETAHTSLRAVTELWTGGLVTTLHCTPSQCSTRC
jgi:hypothetical protein